MDKKYAFEDLYRGETPNFDQIDYLTDVSKLVYEINELLKKYGLVKNGTEKAKYNLPDSLTRIDKNGAIAIHYVGKLPKYIVTPYGEIEISLGELDSSLKNNKKIAKFNQELEKLLGLVEVKSRTFGGNKEYTRPEIMAVSKLPWKEVKQEKQSIFPWRRKKVTEQVTSSLPMPTEVYQTADVYERGNMTKHDLQRQRLITEERGYVKQLMDIVNAKLVLGGHKAYMLPGTESEFSVNGEMMKLSEYVRSYPNAVANMESTLEENKWLGAPTKLNPEEEHIPVSTATYVEDLGREI